MSQKPPRPAFTGLPFRSKLVPFEAHIRHWMKAGKTYVQMAELLQREQGLKVAASTINAFVRVRHRGRGRRAMLPDPEPVERMCRHPRQDLSPGRALKQDSTPDYYPPADPDNL
jgi:hypothetical protein